MTVAAERTLRTELQASSGRRLAGKELAIGLAFLGPALFLLAALVVYPLVFTIVRSLFDRGGDRFVGLDNYGEMFQRSSTRTAIRNNAIWVVVAPTVVTAVGLVLAVLTERVRFTAAIKAVIFMPMAVSFLAAGVIFRFVYEQDPDRGLANAALTSARGVFGEPGRYPSARPSVDSTLVAVGGGWQTPGAVAAGSAVVLGLVGVAPDLIPERAEPALAPPAQIDADRIEGTIWVDFTRGGGGQPGRIDETELAMPSVLVEATRPDGTVAGRDRTDAAGRFSIDGLSSESYLLRLPESNFRQPWQGLSWLGPTLITPSLIIAYTWIWAGFAMVVIAAGLSGIPREAQEAARVDGASEWQVFRRVPLPLLGPVLLVVLVTLAINVMKIFDLVFIIPPTSVQDDANVVALELWRVSFGGERNQGLGSALGVLLFLLVVPFMLLNLRRFRSKAQS